MLLYLIVIYIVFYESVEINEIECERLVDAPFRESPPPRFSRKSVVKTVLRSQRTLSRKAGGGGGGAFLEMVR